MARLFVFSALLLAATLFAGPIRAMADGGDVRTCSFARGFECLPDDGCQEMSIQDMALPRFVRIDMKAKTITSLDKDVPRTSKVASIERMEGVTILHGTEARGWSIALGDESGDVTLTASGDDEGFVVFGSCMNQ